MSGVNRKWLSTSGDLIQVTNDFLIFKRLIFFFVSCDFLQFFHKMATCSHVSLEWFVEALTENVPVHVGSLAGEIISNVSERFQHAV